MRLPRTRGVTIAIGLALAILCSPAPASASFPGANGSIAYTHQPTDPVTGQSLQPQIWLVNAGGSEKRQLTHFAGGASRPKWSPDGQQLTFQSGNGKQAPRTVWIANAEGDEIRRVTPENGGAFVEPSFSADGSKLVMSGFIPGEELGVGVFEINVDGTGLQRLRAAGTSPAWSPDGETIAFEEDVSDASQVMAMDADGSDARQLTSTPRPHALPEWTPDGRIAYLASEVGDPANAIYVMNADGTGQQRLHSNPPGGDIESLSWAPDETGIVFSTYLGPGGGAPLTYRLHTVAADGSDELEIVADETADSDPAWQPLPATDTTPPSIDVPATITANATSPKGAAVEFTVSAVDDLDPEPQVSCAPTSGSVFAIGSTEVACTAKDAAGNSSASSFEIVVLGAAEQIQNLIDTIANAGLPHAITDTLESKLEAALAKLKAGKTPAACRKLDAFLKKVKAQSGKN